MKVSDRLELYIKYENKNFTSILKEFSAFVPNTDTEY